MNYGIRQCTRTSNKYKHTLLPFQKVGLLYDFKVHGLKHEELGLKYGISRSAVRLAIMHYQKSGRVFSLLSCFSKSFLDRHRTKNMEHQNLYRYFKNSRIATKIDETMKPRERVKSYRWIQKRDDHQQIQENTTDLVQTTTQQLCPVQLMVGENNT